MHLPAAVPSAAAADRGSGFCGAARKRQRWYRRPAPTPTAV